MPGRGLATFLGIIVLQLVHTLLELNNAAADRTHQAGQAVAEEQQDDAPYYQQLHWSDAKDAKKR
jgi:hypothetical protein